MSRTHLLVLLGLSAAVAAAAALVWWTPKTSDPSPATAPAPSAHPLAVSPPTAEVPAEAPPSGPAPAAEPAARERYATDAQRRRHAATRQRIQQALQRRATEQPTPTEPTEPTEPAEPTAPKKKLTIEGNLDESYVRAAVREDLIPLAQECYSNVLAVDPSFGGTLVLEFDVMGDEEVGGIIDDAHAGDGTTMTNPDFAECMSESMMTVEIEPPSGGGVAHVRYPLTFEYDAD